MKTKKEHKLLWTLLTRLHEISEEASERIPCALLEEVLKGRLMLIMWDTSEKCKCCGKPVCRVMATKKLKANLKDLIK